MKPHYRLHYRYHALLERYVWWVSQSHHIGEVTYGYRTPNFAASSTAIKAVPYFIPLS